MKLSFNKKAQFESKLLAIITIISIGIILLFFNTVNDKLFSGFDKYLNESTEYNNTEAHEVLREIHYVENNIWDWAFLAIYIGLIIQIILFSYATRINIAFFWLMVILDIPLFIVGVMLSYIWQKMAENPAFSESILRYPITNTLLGSYFPTALLALFFLISLITFAKPGENQ